MADPLGLVYSKRDNSGAAVWLDGDPDRFGRLSSRRPAAQKKEAPNKEFDFDLNSMGDVWDVDKERLTNDYLKLRDMRVSYEREKDPAKRAQMAPEIIKTKVDLATEIKKSRTARDYYAKKSDEIDKDQKTLLPPDARERLEAWKQDPKRSQNPGIEMPSSIDFGNEFLNRLKKHLPPRNLAKESTIVDGKKVTKSEYYYDKDDMDKAIEATISEMPDHILNTMMVRVNDRAAKGDPAAVEVYNSDNGPAALRDYLKKLGYGIAEPTFQYRVRAKEPVKPTGSGGGGASKNKFVTVAKVETFLKPDKSIDSQFVQVTSKPRNQTERSQDFVISTKLLKKLNKEFNLGIDNLDDYDERSFPKVSIFGTFQSVQENVETGQRTITIVPKRFTDKYIENRKPITINFDDNEAVVKANLNEGDDLDMLFQQEKEKMRKNPTTPVKRKVPLPPGGKAQTGINWAKPK